MPTPLIQFVDVYKSFSGQPVLNGINLSIYPGQITTVIGKSGGGKSVLLKHIVGLITKDNGAILFNGKSLSDMKKSERKAWKKKFSYMFQGTALFDSMTVSENIALPLKEKSGLSEENIAARVKERMAQLDIAQIDQKYPSQLSGGMKKRVALARALITEPEIVLFDEPTTGLDPIRKNMVHSMIADYQVKFGFTGILVSHEIPDIFFISQRVAMLDQGRIIYEGSPEEIQQSGEPVIRDFLKGLESRHDSLTGMVSQSYSEERFRQELARLQRYRTPFSMIVLTVKNLTDLYDSIGLKAGQKALQNFAKQVMQSLRITDICSRTALNKIIIVLPNTGFDQARNVCTKLSKTISGKDILESPSEAGVCLEISAGFAEARENSQLETMTIRAESQQNTFYEFRVC